MTLSEQFCGIPTEPPLAERERWCEWMRQQHPMLTAIEVLREHNERSLARVLDAIDEWESVPDVQQRACAAMRAFLQEEYADRLAICRVVGGVKGARLNELESALASDAGRDYVPRIDLESAQRACAAMRDALITERSTHGHSHWDSTMQHGVGCPICIAQHAAADKTHAALATDAGKDYVLRTELESVNKACAALRDGMSDTNDLLRDIQIRDYDEGRVGTQISDNNDALASDVGKDYVHRSELEAVNKSCAEMRDRLTESNDVLRVIRIDDECDEARAGVQISDNNDALGSDAGRDYVPRAELEALKHLYELDTRQYRQAASEHCATIERQQRELEAVKAELEQAQKQFGACSVCGYIAWRNRDAKTEDCQYCAVKAREAITETSGTMPDAKLAQFAEDVRELHSPDPEPTPPHYKLIRRDGYAYAIERECVVALQLVEGTALNEANAQGIVDALNREAR